MQVYTKILIGMAVGVAVGLLLGPKSALLPADTVDVADLSELDLRTDREDEHTKLAMPAVPLLLSVRSTTYEARADARGERHRVATWSKVSFRWTQALALSDTDARLHEALGRPQPGQRVEAWLKLTPIALESGGFKSLPEKVSGLGVQILSWLRPIGSVFMSLIKMVIVPLVFSSLLVGVAGLGDIRKLGRLGAKTLGAYLITTALAVSIGLICAHLLRPGYFVASDDRAALTAQFSNEAGARAQAAAETPSAIDNILSIIPVNPVASLASGDMLQVIFFAIIFGIALTLMDGRHADTEAADASDSPAKLIVTFFDRIQQAMVLIIHMVMALAPYGVLALVADVVGQSGLSVLSALLMYALAVLVGLGLHAALVYGGLVRLFTKLPLLSFLRAIRPAQMIGFSTSSSSATLPVSMECAEENLGMSNATASFVLPLGATMNMDGTALYQGVAAIFIAQVFQVDLTLGDQLAIVATATLASVGAAGVPGAGMITLAMVLTSVGIPAVGVALILGMDRILDMFRTAVNVTGDLAVASMVASTEGEPLRYLRPSIDRADPDRGFEHRLDRHPHKVKPE